MKRGEPLRHDPVRAAERRRRREERRAAEPLRPEDAAREKRRADREAARKPSQLKTDPAKIAAFVQRDRGKLARGTPNRPLPVPPVVRAEAFARSRGLCVVCLHREGFLPWRMSPGAVRRLVATGTLRWAEHPHHVLPQGRFRHLAAIADNIVGVCATCHADHHVSPRGRMPKAALPACAIELAEREGVGWYLDRYYEDSMQMITREAIVAHRKRSS